MNNEENRDGKDNEDGEPVDRNLVEATMKIIGVIDEHSIDPSEYWRVFESVRALTNFDYQRPIDILGEMLIPHKEALGAALAGYYKSLISRPACDAVDLSALNQAAVPAATSPPTAYLLAMIKHGEIVGVDIFNRETPYVYGIYFAKLDMQTADDFQAARASLLTTYPTRHPELAARFPIRDDEPTGFPT